MTLQDLRLTLMQQIAFRVEPLIQPFMEIYRFHREAEEITDANLLA